jgi:2'-deoxynucleoside 5'-phosphate N-hydrolase
MNPLNIYFGASISGGREDVELYSGIISHLKTKGKVLTEHIGDKTMDSSGEPDKFLAHDRDIGWLLSADVFVADISTPSIGVGYETGRIFEHGLATGHMIPMLCLYRIGSAKPISGMIYGNKAIAVRTYTTLDEAKLTIDKFFEKIKAA